MTINFRIFGFITIVVPLLLLSNCQSVAPTSTEGGEESISLPVGSSTPKPTSVPNATATLEELPSITPTVISVTPTTIATPTSYIACAGRIYNATENNNEIAFVGKQEGQDYLFIYSINEAKQKRITSGNLHPAYPAWSPDGKKIAFKNLAPNGSNSPNMLVIVNQDGTELISKSIKNFIGTEIAWSKDSDQIAFDVLGEDNLPEIMIFNLKTAVFFSAMKSIPAVSVHDLSWSNDGSLLSFSAFIDDKYVNSRIFFLKLSTHNLESLKTEGIKDYSPVWSPAQGNLIWITEITGKYPQLNLSKNEHGTEYVTVTDSDIFKSFPQWSPDGKIISYVGILDPYSNDTPKHYSIHLFSLDQMVDTVVETSTDPIENVVWSPNGHILAYFLLKDKTRTLVLLNLCNYKNVAISTGVSYQYAPTWKP